MSAKTGSRVVATFHRIAADLAGLQINNRHLRSVAGVLQVAVEKEETQSLNGSQVCSDTADTEPAAANVPEEQVTHEQDALLQSTCCLNMPRARKFIVWLPCLLAQMLSKVCTWSNSCWQRRRVYK